MSDKVKLFIYDDDGLTFEYVIKSLSDVFGWTIYQSEQIALIAHYNGKALLKEGTQEEIEKYKDLISKTRLIVK
tara:strand:- start:405 stop:626 length:222 start_codon:yes stop_codon:yes gene_type:complete